MVQSNFLPASCELCHLLITFANRLNPDQAQQSVQPDLDPSRLELMLFLKENFEKSNVEKYLQTTKNHEKLPSMLQVNTLARIGPLFDALLIDSDHMVPNTSYIWIALLWNFYLFTYRD